MRHKFREEGENLGRIPDLLFCFILGQIPKKSKNTAQIENNYIQIQACLR